MNAAFSIWDKKIAPVFDTATLLAIVATRPDGKEPAMVSLDCHMPETIISSLLEHQVSVLVCGAISRPFYDTIATRNIRIHPFVTGKLDEVMQAWRTETLDEQQFRMPGCGHASDTSRPGTQPHRLRRRGYRHAGTNVPYGASVIPRDREACRCPRCGHELTHVPGMPCSKHRCPNCYAPMVRSESWK